MILSFAGVVNTQRYERRRSELAIGRGRRTHRRRRRCRRGRSRRLALARVTSSRTPTDQGTVAYACTDCAGGRGVATSNGVIEDLRRVPTENIHLPLHACSKHAASESLESGPAEPWRRTNSGSSMKSWSRHRRGRPRRGVSHPSAALGGWGRGPRPERRVRLQPAAGCLPLPAAANDFRGAKRAFATYEADTERVSTLLPPGVEPDSDPVVCQAWVCWYPWSVFGEFLEAYIFVRVSADGIRYWFQPLIFTDSGAPAHRRPGDLGIS